MQLFKTDVAVVYILAEICIFWRFI